MRLLVVVPMMSSGFLVRSRFASITPKCFREAFVKPSTTPHAYYHDAKVMLSRCLENRMKAHGRFHGRFHGHPWNVSWLDIYSTTKYGSVVEKFVRFEHERSSSNPLNPVPRALHGYNNNQCLGTLRRSSKGRFAAVSKRDFALSFEVPAP